jgi:hypothetical protein
VTNSLSKLKALFGTKCRNGFSEKTARILSLCCQFKNTHFLFDYILMPSYTSLIFLVVICKK